MQHSLALGGSSAAAPAQGEPWLSLLARTQPARRWNELDGARAVLLSPAADPRLRDVGQRLAALQRSLMSPATSQPEFAAMSHGIDQALQAAQGAPGQAVLIAYADLQVQQATAARRWPRPDSPPPPAPAWAAPPA